jgi:hypothetical protein
MTDDGKRVELHHCTADRAEAADVAKGHPDIVARLSNLAFDWKARLPAKPKPDCLAAAPDPVKASPPGSAANAVASEVRTKTSAR